MQVLSDWQRVRQQKNKNMQLLYISLNDGTKVKRKILYKSKHYHDIASAYYSVNPYLY